MEAFQSNHPKIVGVARFAFEHMSFYQKRDKIDTCTRASSPSCEQDNVGVVPRKPESVTSSTVSPIESTRVAFTKDTMMYESNSSENKETSLCQRIVHHHMDSAALRSYMYSKKQKIQ